MNDMKYLFPLWIKYIKKQGIKKIDGAIVADASVYDDTLTPPSWIYGDLGNYYGAGASGLSFHENAFLITLKPGAKFMDTAKISDVDPPIPYIKNKKPRYYRMAIHP